MIYTTLFVALGCFILISPLTILDQRGVGNFSTRQKLLYTLAFSLLVGIAFAVWGQWECANRTAR